MEKPFGFNRHSEPKLISRKSINSYSLRQHDNNLFILSFVIICSFVRSNRFPHSSSHQSFNAIYMSTETCQSLLLFSTPERLLQTDIRLANWKYIVNIAWWHKMVLDNGAIFTTNVTLDLIKIRHNGIVICVGYFTQIHTLLTNVRNLSRIHMLLGCYIIQIHMSCSCP